MAKNYPLRQFHKYIMPNQLKNRLASHIIGSSLTGGSLSGRGINDIAKVTKKLSKIKIRF